MRSICTAIIASSEYLFLLVTACRIESIGMGDGGMLFDASWTCVGSVALKSMLNAQRSGVELSLREIADVQLATWRLGSATDRWV